MLDEIKEEITKFETLQNELEDYGTRDTEPDTIFQECLLGAIGGKSVDIVPTSAGEWGLYKLPGVGAAVKRVSGKTKRICSLILKTTLAEQDEVKAYIRKYCWRIAD